MPHRSAAASLQPAAAPAPVTARKTNGARTRAGYTIITKRVRLRVFAHTRMPYAQSDAKLAYASRAPCTLAFLEPMALNTRKTWPGAELS